LNIQQRIIFWSIVRCGRKKVHVRYLISWWVLVHEIDVGEKDATDSGIFVRVPQFLHMHNKNDQKH